MMLWNYRIIKRTFDNIEGEALFSLHEVYYDEDGKVEGWTQDAILDGYDSVRELLEDLALMIHDVVRRDVLSLDRLEAEVKRSKK